MNYYSTIEELETYRNHLGLSQSELKKILVNDTKIFKESIPMILGSVLDAMLTCPDLLDTLFYQGIPKRPSTSVKKIIDDAYESVVSDASSLVSDGQSIEINPSIETFKTLILEKAKENNYQPNWGPDAIWTAIIKDGEDYWKELIGSENKMVVTSNEWTTCEKIANLTYTSSITGKYFIEDENDKFYQKPLYWKVDNIDCKGLLDILVFEEETKTIYYVDIKSTSVNSLDSWFNVCKTKNYVFQMAWYYEGICQNYKEMIDDGWAIKMRWMVLPLQGKFLPWIVPVTDTMLQMGTSGYDIVSGFIDLGNLQRKTRRFIHGWTTALEIYKKTKEQGLTDFEIFHYEMNGKLTDQESDKRFFT